MEERSRHEVSTPGARRRSSRGARGLHWILSRSERTTGSSPPGSRTPIRCLKDSHPAFRRAGHDVAEVARLREAGTLASSATERVVRVSSPPSAVLQTAACTFSATDPIKEKAGCQLATPGLSRKRCFPGVTSAVAERKGPSPSNWGQTRPFQDSTEDNSYALA
jgi:hypothetical protein